MVSFPFWMRCHGNVTARDVGWIWMFPTLLRYGRVSPDPRKKVARVTGDHITPHSLDSRVILAATRCRHCVWSQWKKNSFHSFPYPKTQDIKYRASALLHRRTPHTSPRVAARLVPLEQAGNRNCNTETYQSVTFSVLMRTDHRFVTHSQCPSTQ